MSWGTPDRTPVYTSDADANLKELYFHEGDGVAKYKDSTGTIYSFTGEQGPQGPKGDPGTDGATGPQGDTGSRGPRGYKGNDGDTGSRGPRGYRGYTGDTGPTGPKGDTGSRGPRGYMGDTGPTGPQGPEGTFNGNATVVSKTAGGGNGDAVFNVPSNCVAWGFTSSSANVEHFDSSDGGSYLYLAEMGSQISIRVRGIESDVSAKTFEISFLTL